MKMGLFKPNVEKMERNKDVKGLIQAISKGAAVKGGVRFEAIWALQRIGEPAVEPLIQALKDKDKVIRFGAADALGRIGDARAVEPLIQALKDEDYTVRAWAALNLGRIGDAKAVEPLTEALKDENDNVRHYAAEALEKLKAKKG
jgi:HEAT repeat protein